MNPIVRVIEWFALLPIWRRLAKPKPLQFVLASATVILWPVLIVAIAFDGNREEPAAEGAAAVRAAPGAQAGTDSVRITLHQIANPWTSESAFEQPPEGTRLVAFEVTIDFRDIEGTHMANSFHFKLIDSADFAYAEILGGPEPTLNAIELSAGQKTRGWIAFEVQAAMPLKLLKYEPEAPADEVIEFSFQ